MSETSTNPLRGNSGLPHFDQIKPVHVKPAVEEMLTQARQQFHQVEQHNNSDWESLILPLNEIEALYHHTWSPVSHLNSVLNSQELREVYQEMQPKLVAFGLEMGQSKTIYDALCQMKDGPVWDTLDAGQKRAVEGRLLSATLSGIALSGDKQKRFNQIAKELSQLGTEVSNHVLDATKDYELVLTDKKQINGLTPDFIERAHQDYVSKHKPEKTVTKDSGPWLISLDMTSFVPFMENCKDEHLRETIYRAFISRASSGKHDNRELLVKILKYRQEKARLLGFKNYAELSLSEKMAESVEEVFNLEEELRLPSWQAAQKELEELKQFSSKQGKTTALKPWDMSFWSKRLQEQKFQYTDEDIKPYFSLSKVLDGLFDLVQRLFDISVKERTTGVATWHRDVRFFDLFDKKAQHIASFYLDPYSRPENKRGGAWMDVCVSRRKDITGKLRLPVAYLVCNFTPPVGDKPSLLTFREVETIFHEFGHGLQHMLTTVEHSDVSGIEGVEWDAVELPSQFMENWCYHRKTFFSMAKHFKTSDAMPESLYNKLLQSKTFMAGMQMLRQLQFGLIDMQLHSDEAPSDYQAVDDRYREVASKTALFAPLSEDRFLCSFLHIFAGGYAAGYYSYKWAEVLSADAFAAFEEAGLENEDLIKKIGQKFKETVLALGGSLTPAEVFKLFRGRAPKSQALLKAYGLLENGA